MIAAIVIAIIVLGTPVGLGPVLNITLRVILIIVIYLLIRTGCGYRGEDPKIYSNLDSRITELKESVDRIEKKVDKIDGILEKVSE